MTPYPIVHIETPDGLTLHGLFLEPVEKTKTIFIHIHGSAGNFYGNKYFNKLSTAIRELGTTYLATNNRGNHVYELEKNAVSYGVSLEKFEDCVVDIDAWIDFALERGYENIILEGHSYGTEKIVYYMNKGKYTDKVKGVILLGFSDNVGTQIKYEKSIGASYLDEAVDLYEKGKGETLLKDIFGLCGEMPISAQTYLHGFTEDCENAVALPLRKGKDLVFFRNIHVPILGVISDNQEGEYTIIPISEAVELLKGENNLAEVYIISGTDHGFAEKENELVEKITEFLKRRVIPTLSQLPVS